MYRVKNDPHVKNTFTNCSEIHTYNTRAANAANNVTTKMRPEKGKQAFQQTGAKVQNELMLLRKAAALSQSSAWLRIF